MTLSRNWHDLAWTDFSARQDNTVTIPPVAAVEQHGPHLPVSVDSTINAGVRSGNGRESARGRG